jgi:two-component system sensor histidine kinase TctE
MQADLAQREGASAEDLKLSLRQVGRSSVRATHTVNQLLSLARAESSGVVLEHEACDLAQIAVDVMHDCAPRALLKFLDMGYEGPEPGTPGTAIWGNATLLREMVLNLVDNAINYTPSTQDAPGVITTRLLVDPFSRAVVLQVEDSGPGIAQAERDRDDIGRRVGDRERRGIALLVARNRAAAGLPAALDPRDVEHLRREVDPDDAPRVRAP